MNTRLRSLSVLLVLLTLQACCNGYEFRSGGCAGGSAPTAQGCQLENGQNSTPDNVQACCSDQPFSPEDQEAFTSRNATNTCCAGTTPRLTIVDDPCAAFASETTGAYDPAQAAGVCASNFAELSPDGQIDNQCCNAGALRPEAATTTACITRFPTPPPTPVPTPAPPPTLDAGAAANFCSSYETNFSNTHHNASGCVGCSIARIDPVTGRPPAGCPRNPSDNTIDQLSGGARAISVAVRELGNANTLIGGNNLRLGQAPTNAATAGGRGPKQPVSNPIVPLAKSGTSSSNRGGSTGGKAGGGSGFLGGSSLGTGVLLSQEKTSVAVDTAGGTPTGGGGNFPGRGYGGGDEEDSEGIEVAEGPDSEQLSGANFNQETHAASSMETPADYWDRVARALSLFDVVTRGYRRETGRWILSNARAIQSPRSLGRKSTSPPASRSKGSKRR